MNMSVIKKVVIKYDVDGNFIIDNFYTLNFNYLKASSFVSIENINGEYEKSILYGYNGKDIEMKYAGFSNIDGKKIFILYISQINRSLNLDKILDKL